MSIEEPGKSTEEATSESGPREATSPEQEASATSAQEPSAGGEAADVREDAEEAAPSPPEESAGAEPEAAAEPPSEPAEEPAATEPAAEEPAPKPAKKRKRKAQPIEEDIEEEETGQKDWYILKVSSNREDSIRNALERRVKIHGLEKYFDEIIVPVEHVTEFTKSGKKRTVKKKLYPGYIVVHMEINDETWFLVRETPGIGDFTGAGGKPVPMLKHEVDRILGTQAPEGKKETPQLQLQFEPGSRVKVTDSNSPFRELEGDVDQIDEKNGHVTVMINIFNRRTPVELEHWQLEPV